MTYLVRRTCTEVRDDVHQDVIENPSRPLEDFRETAAYVLLGDPGAGKTTAFEQESGGCPGGIKLTARDFVDLGTLSERHGATLFIDGLDEMRAGAADGQTPFGRIRARLDALGRPAFRLSCRDAYWFGTIDRTSLECVSRDGKVTVLRLDHLTEANVREILHHRPDIADADAFMHEARIRGIGGLLANPKSLEMLADAVAGGIWPETRMETFELACRKLVREHHPVHRSATPQFDDVSVLLDVAGRLCAVMLLAGNAGYTRNPATAGDHDYPGLEQLPGRNRDLLQHVTGTKLFSAPSGGAPHGLAVPVHQENAEFLAAGYLASLIDDGLPAGRILSLITGHDGVVVSKLQGLAAWLAAHSKAARANLIARDSLGTVLYGDVRGFSTDEKRQVLDGVSSATKNHPRIAGKLLFDHRLRHLVPRLGDLATPDMAESFRRILTGPARDDGRQSLVFMLLVSFKHCDAIPGIVELILDVLRDDTWEHGVRTAALDVLIRHERDAGHPAVDLHALLAEIDAGTISDPDDDLLGSLLIELYPGELTVPRLLQYLRTPGSPSYLGSYFRFWSEHVPETSSVAQLSELLDLIVENTDRLRPALVGRRGEVSFLRRVPYLLLKRVIVELREDVPTHRLRAWLEVVSDPELRFRPDDSASIRQWLERHPDVLKNLIDMEVEGCSGSPGFSRCMHLLERCLFRVRWPPDWCLDRALAATDSDVAEYFIRKVADFLNANPHDETLSRDNVEQRLAEKPALMEPYNRRLAAHDESIACESRIQEQDDEHTRRRQQNWRRQVKAHEHELRENRCPPGLLHVLAGAYFGNYVDVQGNTSMDRLRNLIGDESLARLARQGLRYSIARDDLPTDTEIIRLRSRKQTHNLALPVLAGLEEAVHDGTDRVLLLDDRQMRLALAVHYTVAKPVAAPRPPSWFPPLLKTHPHVVSEVLTQVVLSGIQGDTEISAKLYEPAYSEDHEHVARLATLPLLRRFPVRCTDRQLTALNYLLVAALLRCERASFLELVEEKLARRSMNVAQRVYWLAAGLVGAPESFTARLERFVSGNERRTRRLAELVVHRFRVPERLLGHLNVPALRMLIRLAGPSFRPFSPAPQASSRDSDEGGPVTGSMEAALGIAHLIDRLASLPSPEATQALQALSSEDALRPWRSQLVDAGYRQNERRREHDFHHCDIEQALAVLDNRRPANAADLAALTTSYLREIARRIRDGNTSDWRQYWNVDSRNRPQKPKPEDACRDALLSDLQAKLISLHVDAQPEGRYADDKRSDIRVSHGDSNVPVEIKKCSHRDLWSAIRMQLIARYTRDPGAGGYGIYLVFWFGAARCQSPERGARPKNADELEERLRDTLSAEDARLISFCVVDVSKPDT